MIAHEEFREAYKENVELQVAILSGPIQDEMSFSYTIECNGIDEPVSISLDENNEFTAKIQTTFSLVAVDQGLRGRLLLAGGQVCTPSIDAPFHKLIMPDVETINFEVKSGEMQFTVGVTLVIPKMSYPMYSLTVECLSLPMVGGGLLDVSDPFLRIHKKSQAFGTSVQVFESEVIQDNSNPLFKPIKISNQRLCSGSLLLTKVTKTGSWC